MAATVLSPSSVLRRPSHQPMSCGLTVAKLSQESPKGASHHFLSLPSSLYLLFIVPSLDLQVFSPRRHELVNMLPHPFLIPTFMNAEGGLNDAGSHSRAPCPGSIPRLVISHHSADTHFSWACDWRTLITWLILSITCAPVSLQ